MKYIREITIAILLVCFFGCIFSSCGMTRYNASKDLKKCIKSASNETNISIYIASDIGLGPTSIINLTTYERCISINQRIKFLSHLNDKISSVNNHESLIDNKTKRLKIYFDDKCYLEYSFENGSHDFHDVCIITKEPIYSLSEIGYNSKIPLYLTNIEECDIEKMKDYYKGSDFLIFNGDVQISP